MAAMEAEKFIAELEFNEAPKAVSTSKVGHG